VNRPERSPVIVRAHAKLTRSLRIIGTRPDGYHLIDAEMVSLDLHDVVTITPGRTGISAHGPFADGIPLDGSNLVIRALDLVTTDDAHIALDKRIPHGGGLGGGSTDAASVMRWAGFGTTPNELARASALGADIAFCLVGGRAHVRGIGEIIEALSFVERTVTLIIPPLAVSSPAVYRAWDELGGPESDGLNDLEAAALKVEPLLQRWRDAIGDRVGATPTLAGSGATWYVEGEHQDALADLLNEGAKVVVARTVPTEVAAPGE
jgi:4-diphosphocytidyl-2-C-methyl-D-erythritol kinase